MESIILHIEYLLQHHDCVILPGLGAFIATSQSARYVEEQGCFMPPRREICFNTAVKSDDGLLVNSIRRKQKIGFEEARMILERDVQDLQISLATDGEISVGKIGILTQEADGRIIFQPSKRYSAPESEGNMPIYIESLKKSEREATTNKEGEAETMTKDPAYYYVRINKMYAQIAASILLVMIVGLSLLIPTGANVPEPIEASVVPVKHIIPSSRQAIQIPADTTSIREDKVREKEVKESYSLIVASFKSRTGATNYISSMKEHASEHDMELKMEKTSTHWMVVAATSTEKQPLQRKINSEEFSKVFPESWIRKETKQ